MAEHRTQRRLAAILAADVVGFSRLMEIDEVATLTALKTRRRDVLDPLVAKHQGRIFKTTGDGVLIEFGSAVNAVECAIELQQGMVAANTAQPAEREIVLRIGINLGDVLVEGSDLYGDGINVAARLEGLAEPGSVYLSQAVFNHVRGKVSHDFEDLGEKALKNILEPVRVYAATREGQPARPSGSQRGPASRGSIAVLPFTNMSEDPAQQYLSDGITEDIITELSRFRELIVIARNSSFQYRDKAMDMKRVGRELGVEYLVEGSMRKIRERLRITAQLVEVSTGTHLWAEKYDTELEGVFAIQDQLTQTVAATLVGRVARSGAEKARRKPTELWAAYECYLLAQEHCDRYEIDRAITLLRRAVELDPEYAQAYAMLADCHATKYFFDADEQNLKAALPFAQRALAIDDNDGISHYAMGYIHLYYHRFDAAGSCLAKAVSLNPNSVLFASHYALWLSRVGRLREALEMLDFVALRDPFQQPYYYQIRAIALFTERRYEDALQALNQASSLQYYDHALMAAANAHLGSEQEAGLEAAEVDRMRPGTTIPWMLRIAPFKHQADRDHLAEGLRKAGLPD